MIWWWTPPKKDQTDELVDLLSGIIEQQQPLDGAPHDVSLFFFHSKDHMNLFVLLMVFLFHMEGM